jgi:hypothetical protein
MSKYLFQNHGAVAKERALNGLKGMNKGLDTFPNLDKYIFGLRREMQIVLFGETKSGKSAICNQMIYNALVANQKLENPYKIYINYWSLEMTGASLFQRFMSMYLYEKHGLSFSSNDLEGYTTNKLTEDQIHTYYDEAMEYVSKLAYYQVIDIPHKVNEIEKYLQSFHNQLGGFNKNDQYIYNDPSTFVLNVIDHMKLLSPGSERDEFVRADNIFDEKYVGNVRVNNNATFEPGAPRNYTVGITASYTFK